MKITAEQKIRIWKRVKQKALKDLKNPKLATVARMTIKKLS